MLQISLNSLTASCCFAFCILNFCAQIAQMNTDGLLRLCFCILHFLYNAILDLNILMAMAIRMTPKNLRITAMPEGPSTRSRKLILRRHK